MLKTIKILIPLTIIFATLLPAKSEAVTVHVCSKTPYKIVIAIGYKNEHGWQAEGWYEVLPGECVSPNTQPFSNTVFYYHAKARAGDIKWLDNSGPSFCVDSQAFHLKNTPNCKRKAQFKKSQAKSGNASHTITLKCDSCIENIGESFGGNPRLEVYGKWCGPGHPRGDHPGAPIDQLDQTCHDHDRAYHQCNRTTNGSKRTKCEADADLKMVVNLTKLAGQGKLNPEQIAYSSVMAHTMIVAAKARYAWSIIRNIEAEGQRFMQRVDNDVQRVARDSKRTLDKHLGNAWNDITKGPGKGNEICKHTGLC